MAKDANYFMGVDVGGTKIYAALVRPSGQVVATHRTRTPQAAAGEEILEAVIATISALIEDADVKPKQVAHVGLAVPGVVDYETNQIVASPNISVSGRDLVGPVRKAVGIDATLVNDTDAAALGEQWVGSARGKQTAIGIFVGTGIGGGILVHRKLLRGERHSAAEIGHMILDRNGPECGCGAHGCLEAIASRTAIERQLREAMAAGEPTILRDLTEADAQRIRSGTLAEALHSGDRLVTRILRQAGEALGKACINLRHLFEPETIILGGGVIEACGDFMLPIIDRQVRLDPYTGSRPGCEIVQSALADDAGILGAAAVAMQSAGQDPFSGKTAEQMEYPAVDLDGKVLRIGKKSYDDCDVLVRVDGRAKKRSKREPRRLAGPGKIHVADIAKACKGGPELLVIGSAGSADEPLHEDVAEWLRRRAIRVDVRPLDKAIKLFQDTTARKALLALTGE